MKIMVTGGTGFISSYLITQLVEQGDDVVAYELFVDTGLLSLLLGNKLSKVKMISGDILDLALMTRTIKEHKVRKIAHLAAVLTKASAENPTLGIWVNSVGTANVFEAARLMDIEKVAWASSTSTVCTEENPEAVAYHPRNVYGGTKALAEILAAHYVTSYNMDFTGLRFPFMYGEGQRSPGGADVTRELIIKPALGQHGVVRNYREGDMVSWLYAKDAANIVALALNAKKPKVVNFNVGGDLRSVKEAREIVLKQLPGAKITIEPGVSRSHPKYDMSAFIKETGYKARFSLEDGIRDTISLTQKRYGKS